jgi:hypothetical protein
MARTEDKALLTTLHTRKGGAGAFCQVSSFYYISCSVERNAANQPPLRVCRERWRQGVLMPRPKIG